MDSAAVTFDYLDECREIQDTLTRTNHLLTSIIEAQDTVIFQQRQDSILQARITKEYIQQGKEYEQAYKKARNNGKFYEITTYVLVGFITVITPVLYFHK